jgi:hypothetical protein
MGEIETPARSENPYGHLVGHRFPGGEHLLQSHEAWLWADAVRATPDHELAHPGLAYMVGLHGGGASIADIMDLLDADRDSGVLFGELEVEFAQPLRPDRTYTVTGEILDVERKHGRRAGVFDRVRFVHVVSEAATGAPVAKVTHVWIFPRAAEDGA